MKIEHIAIWTNNLEEMRDFYVKFFNGVVNNKYTNTQKSFESYFISFDNGARLELMRIPELVQPDNINTFLGYAHMAFSVGSKQDVDDLTQKINKAGYQVISEPRLTGDAYYESCFLDPDGNQVELVAEKD